MIYFRVRLTGTTEFQVRDPLEDETDDDYFENAVRPAAMRAFANAIIVEDAIIDSHDEIVDDEVYDFDYEDWEL